MYTQGLVTKVIMKVHQMMYFALIFQLVIDKSIYNAFCLILASH